MIKIIISSFQEGTPLIYLAIEVRLSLSNKHIDQREVQEVTNPPQVIEKWYHASDVL